MIVESKDTQHGQFGDGIHSAPNRGGVCATSSDRGNVLGGQSLNDRQLSVSYVDSDALSFAARCKPTIVLHF